MPPTFRRLSVAPRTEYGVARIQQEFGRSKSTAAAMFSVVDRGPQPDDSLAQLLARKAFIGSGDSVIRFKGRVRACTWGGVSYVAGEPRGDSSCTTGQHALFAAAGQYQYARLDPTRTSLTGFKAGATMNRVGGRHGWWNLKHHLESPTWEPNDIGRLSAGDGPKQQRTAIPRDTSGADVPKLFHRRITEYGMEFWRRPPNEHSAERSVTHLEELLGQTLASFAGRGAGRATDPRWTFDGTLAVGRSPRRPGTALRLGRAGMSGDSTGAPSRTG